jgi:hypothetical protein
MSRSGVSHRGRWGLDYNRSVWIGIYVVDARGYCLGDVERVGGTGGGPRAGGAEGRDWLVSMGKKGLRNRLMAILTREGLYAAVPKSE